MGKKLIFFTFLLVVFVAFFPFKTFADGMVIPPPHQFVRETDQKAVIWHDGKTETMIVSIAFKGDAREFVWVIPVPAKPEVTEGVDELFTGLAQLTMIKGQIAPGYSGMLESINLGERGGGVTVIETKKVGIFDIAVLSAESSTALREWLEQNDYDYPKDREHLLTSYVNKGWYFVAAKVSTEGLPIASGMKTGHATPLKITFDSEKIVYPLKISGKAAELVGDEGEILGAFSFEDGTTQGWYGGQVVDGDAHDGEKIYQMRFILSPQAKKLAAFDNYAFRNFDRLTVGKDYVFSAYVKASSEAAGYARLTTEGESVVSTVVDLNGLTDWKRIELPFKASRKSHQLNLSGQQVSTGSTLYWDAIQIEEGTTASEFKDELIPVPQINVPSAEDELINLLLYVFADHKKEVPGWNIEYAGKVNKKTIENLAYDDNGDPWIKADKKMYLTKLTRSMRQSQMTADVYLRDTEDNDPVGGGSVTAWGGIIQDAGWRLMLVLGLPIVIEIAVVGYVWWRRYKK